MGSPVGKRNIAEQIDPTHEDACWRENFSTRPYVRSGASFDDYRAAYSYGIASYARYADRGFDAVEATLGRDWPHACQGSHLTWDAARPATRDAWNRLADLARSMQCPCDEQQAYQFDPSPSEAIQ
ncbi:MAG: hypothetical protein V4858_03030 [Pseudomonadota bacterium]